MSRHRRNPTVWRALVAAGAVTALLAMASRASAQLPAAACSDFTATAAADGVRTTASPSGAELFGELNSEGPAAQVHVDSLGTSVARAGAPYPGTAAAGLLAMQGRAEDYPLMTTSSYPVQPDDEATAPGVVLSSHSEERAGAARAVVGNDDGGAETSAGRAEARAAGGCGDDGTISAVADSLNEAVRFGGDLLRLGRIHSHASVTIHPDGMTEISSRLDVAEITVAGNTAVLTDEGLRLGDSDIPVPSATPLDETLAEAGITVIPIEPLPQPDGNGIMAAGLVVATRGPHGVTTYTFGRAYATASSAPLDAPTDAPGRQVGPEPDTGSATAGSDPTVPAAAADMPARVDADRRETGQAPAGANLTSGIGPITIPALPLAIIYLALVTGAATVAFGSTRPRREVKRLWT